MCKNYVELYGVKMIGFLPWLFALSCAQPIDNGWRPTDEKSAQLNIAPIDHPSMTGFEPIEPGNIPPMIAKTSQFHPLSGAISYGGGGGRKKARTNARNALSANPHWLIHWNEMAIDASGQDHIPDIGEGIVAFGFGDQLGPGRSSRAMAIVHIAIFEAVNAIIGGYESYLGIDRVSEDTSLRMAIAQAAHDTLTAMYPSQSESFALELAHDLGEVRPGPAKKRGIELGKSVAAGILNLREHDGSAHREPVVGIDFFTSEDPGKWRPDPISGISIAMGAIWHSVTPFVLASADQFRAPSPPPLTSEEYAAAYEEVKRLGGDGVITSTERTAEETEIGIYWAYDGTPSLCAPPRLYNQIAMLIAKQKRSSFMDMARLLALVNVAMAESGLAIWESKYFYQYWRPVTGIREADPGTGPSGLGDGNDATVGDIAFTPMGAPASNTNRVDFTPPFPAYPSGHAGFGGALFQILRRFYGTDDIPFTFVSDEFNGVTRDRHGNIRPLKPRSFSSLSEAEEENGQSRIYLGIHWSFDKTEGIAQGRKVADHVFDNMFLPMEM